MTAEEHNKTLATLYFIYSGIHGLTLIGLLLLVIAVEAGFGGSTSISSSWFAVGTVIFFVLLLFVGILPLIVGLGFRNRKRWVKPAGTALAVVSMVNIPIGTALGIYTLKFFRSEGGIKLYGGKATTARDHELDSAMQGARPLMKWADRLK